MLKFHISNGAESPLRHHLELQESSKKPAKLTAWRVFCFFRLQPSPATSFDIPQYWGSSGGTKPKEPVGSPFNTPRAQSIAGRLFRGNFKFYIASVMYFYARSVSFSPAYFLAKGQQAAQPARRTAAYSTRPSPWPRSCPLPRLRPAHFAPLNQPHG